MPGTIKKRYAGSYTVIVDLGRDPGTGRRRQLWRSVKGTKKDAERLLVELLHDRDTGLERPVGRQTVGQYLERWLEDYVAPSLAPRTANDYRRVVRRVLIPALGSLELAALRPSHVQSLYSRLLREGRADGTGGLSPRSVGIYHQVLHAALHHAVRWQLLPRNPADAVQRPSVPRRELLTLSPEQVSRLLAAADETPIGVLARMAVLTGMRRGELLGLRWRDLDLAAGLANIQQTAQRISGQGWVFRQPKTRLSRRSVALSPETVRMLSTHRKSQLEARLLAGSAYQDRDLVFATALGTPLEPGTIARTWYRVLTAAGVGHVRWHDLRHAHATLMLSAGVHPKVVSERLGHASVGITLDTYSHVLPGLQATAAAQLDTLLSPVEAEAI
ncbi:MAG TPA: tyrosine-type recombinase/integrase [Candidatus Limnocylindria bacterium]|nr:tyrosine-type recombinase/integrase [Candidatus Limnocylindria bacterium]